MKCILHIGTEKTGTTVLQDWLYDNQTALGALKIFLSDTIGKTNNRLIPLCFQRRLDDWARTKGIKSLSEKDKYFQGFLEGFSAEVRRASMSHDTFIITSEHLHSRLKTSDEISELHAFLKDNFQEIKVVCYFRNQFDAAVSLYSTALRLGSTEKLDSFIERVVSDTAYFNLFEISEKWSAVFGMENCVFRLYDRSEFIESDLRKDFIRLVDPKIDLTRLNFDRVASNEALAPLQAAAIRAINRAIPYRDSSTARVNKKNALLKQSVLHIGELSGGKVFSGKRSEIEKKFEHSNIEFFAKYFGTENRFLTSGSAEHGFDLSTERLENIVEAFVDSALPILDAGLDHTDVVALQDVARKIEANEVPNLNDARALLKIALRLQPGNRSIKAQIVGLDSGLTTNS